MARWRVRRETAKPEVQIAAPAGPASRPPQEAVHEVDDMLTECHWLAFDAMKPDTS